MKTKIKLNDFKSNVFKNEIKKGLLKGNIKNNQLNDLLILEKYIFNKFYGLLNNNKDYLYDIQYPYFHGFIIDKVRNKYSFLYKNICGILNI